MIIILLMHYGWTGKRKICCFLGLVPTSMQTMKEESNEHMHDHRLGVDIGKKHGLLILCCSLREMCNQLENAHGTMQCSS